MTNPNEVLETLDNLQNGYRRAGREDNAYRRDNYALLVGAVVCAVIAVICIMTLAVTGIQ